MAKIIWSYLDFNFKYLISELHFVIIFDITLVMNKHEKVTIKDIAELCKVSRITVSRVIAGEKNVNPKTREMILQSIRDLGYHLKSDKHILNESNSKSIAVLVDKLTDGVNSKIIEALANQLQANGGFCSILIHPAKMWPQVLEYLSDKYAGIIVPTNLRDHVQILAEASQIDIPILLIHRCIFSSDGYSIATNEYQNVRIAIDYLCGLGHRHIGLVCMPNVCTGFHEVYTGYQIALNDHGIDEDPRYLIRSEMNSFAEGRQIARKLIADAPEITALVVSNDLVVKGIIFEYQLSGRQIPDDISIVLLGIGTNDPDDFDVTFVGSTPSELAVIAVETMMTFIEKSSQCQTLTKQAIALQPKLHVAGSTGPVKK